MPTITNPAGFNIKRRPGESPRVYPDLPLPPLYPAEEVYSEFNLPEIVEKETKPAQAQPEFKTIEEKLAYLGVKKRPEELTRLERLAYIYDIKPEEINAVSKALYQLELERERVPKILNITARLGRAMLRGIGNVLSSVGQFLDMKSGSEEESDLTKIGKQMVKVFEPITHTEWEGIKTLLKPDYLIEQVGEQAGLQIPLLLTGVGGTIGAAKFVASFGAKPLASSVIGSFVGAAMSRPLESMMEGGQAYEQAVLEGKSKEEAARIANKVFDDNLKLYGVDAAQYFVPFLGGKIGAKIGITAIPSFVRKTGALGMVATSQGGEEILQDIFQRRAAGKPIAFDKQMEEQFMMGAMFGAIFSGSQMIAESVYDPLRLREVKELRDMAIKEMLEKSGKAVVEPTPTPPEPPAISLIDTITANPNRLNEPINYPPQPSYKIDTTEPTEAKIGLDNIAEEVNTAGFRPEETGTYTIQVSDIIGYAPGLPRNFIELVNSIKKDLTGSKYAPGTIGKPVKISENWYYDPSSDALIKSDEVKDSRVSTNENVARAKEIIEKAKEAETVTATPVLYFNSNESFGMVSSHPIIGNVKKTPSGVLFRIELEGRKLWIPYNQQAIQYLNRIYDNISWGIDYTKRYPILVAKVGQEIVGIMKPLAIGSQPGRFIVDPPFRALAQQIGIDVELDTINLAKPTTKAPVTKPPTPTPPVAKPTPTPPVAPPTPTPPTPVAPPTVSPAPAVVSHPPEITPEPEPTPPESPTEAPVEEEITSEPKSAFVEKLEREEDVREEIATVLKTKKEKKKAKKKIKAISKYIDKDQLIDKLEVFIEKAKEKGYVEDAPEEIIIKFDGEYIIKNDEESLKEFLDIVRRHYPTGKLKKPEPEKEKTGDDYYSEAREKIGKRIFLVRYDQEQWLTDTDTVWRVDDLENEPTRILKKVEDGSHYIESIRKVLKSFEGSTEANLMGYINYEPGYEISYSPIPIGWRWRYAKPDVVYAIFRDIDGKFFFANQYRLNILTNRFPDAKLFISPDNFIFAVGSDNRILGATGLEKVDRDTAKEVMDFYVEAKGEPKTPVMRIPYPEVEEGKTDYSEAGYSPEAISRMKNYVYIMYDVRSKKTRLLTTVDAIDVMPNKYEVKYQANRNTGIISIIDRGENAFVKDVPEEVKKTYEEFNKYAFRAKETKADKTSSYNTLGMLSEAEGLASFWENISKSVAEYKVAETGKSPIIPRTEGKSLTDIALDFQTIARLNIYPQEWVSKLLDYLNILGVKGVRVNAVMKERGVYSVSINTLTGETISDITINDLYNYATLTHETGHAFDYIVIGKKKGLKSLAARVGFEPTEANEAMFKEELAKCSQFYENAFYQPEKAGAIEYMKYRALHYELFAQWFTVFMLHPKAALDLAPNFTANIINRFPELNTLRESLVLEEKHFSQSFIDKVLDKVLMPFRSIYYRAFKKIPGVKLPSVLLEEKKIASKVYNQLLSMPMWKSLFSDNPAPRKIFRAVVDNAVYGHNAKIEEMLHKYDVAGLFDLPRHLKVRLANLLDQGNRPGGRIFTPSELIELGYKDPRLISAYSRMMEMSKEAKQLLIERLKIMVDYAFLNVEEKAEFDRKINDQFNRIEAYIPLSRRGKWFVFADDVRVVETGRRDVYLGEHQSYEEAYKEAELLRKAGYSNVNVYKPDDLIKRELGRVHRLSVFELENLVEAAGLDIDSDEIKQLLDYLRSKNALNSKFMTRRQIPGYKLNFDYFLDRLIDFANLASRRYHLALANREATRYLGEINPRYEPEHYVYWKKYIEQALFSSDETYIGLRWGISTLALSFSMTYLKQQLLQNLFTLYPYIALHKKGVGVEKLYLSSAKDAIRWLAERRRGVAFQDKELNTLLERAVKSKAISGQFIQTLIGASTPTSKKLMNILHVVGIQTEFWNKLHAAVAGYNLAKEKGITDLNEIYSFMIDTINQSTYLYGKVNAPPFLNTHGYIKQAFKLMFLFRSTHINYLHQFIYMMLKGTPGAKARMMAVRAATMGMFRVLPMGAMATAIIRAIVKALSGEDPEKELMAWRGSEDPAMRALARTTTYGIAGLFNMDYRDILDIGSVFSPSYDPVAQLVGVAYGVADNITEGLELLRKGRTDEAIAKLSSFRVIANAITADIWRKEGKQVQDDLILKFNDFEIFEKGILGITPLRLKEHYNIRNMMNDLRKDYVTRKERTEQRFKELIRMAETDAVLKSRLTAAVMGDIVSLRNLLEKDDLKEIEKHNKNALELVAIAYTVTGDTMPLKVVTTNAQKHSISYEDVRKWLYEVVKDAYIFKAIPAGGR